MSALLTPFMQFGSAVADLIVRFPREASVVLAVAMIASLARRSS